MYFRDLQADLQEYESDNEIVSIDGFLIRGTGRVDDITTISPNSQTIIYEDAEQLKNTQIIYHLNTQNQRVAKEVNGVITEKYLWQNLTTLLAVYNPDNTLKQRYNYTTNRMPTSMTQDNQKYYLSYDQVGSLRAVSDTSHNIIKEVTYDTFGNILHDTNTNLQIPFGFAGGLYDTDTKLTRFGYREYDPFTGKWTAKDPIGFDGGDSNLYGYVLNDPVMFIDPSGLILDEQASRNLANEAKADAKNSGLKGLRNGPADAYRHCLWSCKMTEELGAFDAWTFGTGHEVFDNKLTPEDECRMDLHNNEVGRNLAKDGKGTCQQKCRSALMFDQLWMIDDVPNNGYGY